MTAVRLLGNWFRGRRATGRRGFCGADGSDRRRAALMRWFGPAQRTAETDALVWGLCDDRV